MKLHELLKVKSRGKKRLGQGLGSGKGKTAGRGTKGQKARGKIPATFTGNLAFYKKLPLRRGKGNPKLSIKPKVINLSQLNIIKAKEIVNVAKLLEAKIISEKDAKRGVKILGSGNLSHVLTIKLPVSGAARRKIIELGGKVEDV